MLAAARTMTHSAKFVVPHNLLTNRTCTHSLPLKSRMSRSHSGYEAQTKNSTRYSFVIRFNRRCACIAILVFFFSLLVIWPAFGRQSYVSPFDASGGYAFLDSPPIGLFENGFQFQAGVRPKTQYSLGFDYSIFAGNLTLTQTRLPLLRIGPASTDLAEE